MASSIASLSALVSHLLPVITVLYCQMNVVVECTCEHGTRVEIRVPFDVGCKTILKSGSIFEVVRLVDDFGIGVRALGASGHCRARCSYH